MSWSDWLIICIFLKWSIGITKTVFRNMQFILTATVDGHKHQFWKVRYCVAIRYWNLDHQPDYARPTRGSRDEVPTTLDHQPDYARPMQEWCNEYHGLLKRQTWPLYFVSVLVKISRNLSSTGKLDILVTCIVRRSLRIPSHRRDHRSSSIWQTASHIFKFARAINIMLPPRSDSDTVLPWIDCLKTKSCLLS